MILARVLSAIVYALVAAMIMVILGCATKQPCPVPTADAFATPVGVLYVFDEANMARLAERLEGLANGTCVGLPAPTPLPDGATPS